MNPPEFVTFYSYKGGTGRSMALANVAWILAANGKRVLVIDWDLEAPGLHRYFHPFLADKELVRSDGLIDFVMQYAELAVAKTKRAKGWHKPYANLLRYATSLDHPFTGTGTIDFVPAGRQGADYATRVNAFNWQHFYERLSGGLFLEEAKLSMLDYDYVLIDSRTGVSDTSGICTVQMPNTLVACFTLNTQSIEGCAAVAESADAQRRSAAGKPTLRILPVPTRVESTERAKLNAGMDAARKRFDPLLWHLDSPMEDYWARVAVRYQPFYAYEEVLAVFGDVPGNSQSMLASMESLAGWITGTSTALRLPAAPPAEREAVLARYLRQQREESPYIVRRLTKHTAPVRAVAISPDGEHVVSGDSDGAVIVWQTATGAEVSAFTAAPVRAAAFSSDGQHVVLGSDDGGIRIWPPEALKGLTRFIHPAPVYALALARDPERVICGHADNTLSVLNVKARFEVGAVLTGHSGPIWAVAVTHDGRFAITGSYDRILIRWNLDQRSTVRTYSGHSGEVRSVAVSADGKFILSGSHDNTLRLWELETGRVLRTLEGHTGPVQAVALSPDGRLACSGAADKMVNIWEVATGRLLRQLAGHSAAVNAVAITPDGQCIVSASDDSALILWNVEKAIAEAEPKVVAEQPPAPVPVAAPPVVRPAPAAPAVKTHPPRVTAPPAVGPLVYISFSRRDRDRYFTQFVADLTRQFRAMTGDPPGETVFWWDDNLDAGDAYTWPDGAIHALRTAAVAVCMTSPAYFESVNCGKEFEIFQMRARPGRRGIYLIAWRSADKVPEAISRIQTVKVELEAYQEEGLAYVMRLSRHRQSYERLVDQFARDLAEMVRWNTLEKLSVLPPLQTVANAFAGGEGDPGAPQAGPERVEFVIQAESPFGKPLLVIAQEIAAELDLYYVEGRLDDTGVIERTARSNSILVIIADQPRVLDESIKSNRFPDLSHCALLVVNSGKVSLWKPPRTVGYYAGRIQTEAALRDNLGTAIVKIRHAIMARAAVAGGGSEPLLQTPNLPNIS